MASNALYISIYQELLHDIQSGKYIENEPLPSEESLCRSYNVSRTTVHKALDMLKDADVVYSVQGNGAYVKPHMFAQPLSKFYSFTDSLKSINILIQNEIIDCTIVRADKGLSVATGYPVGTVFHKLIRLRSAKEYPLMIETTYLPKNRFMSLDTEILSNGSLYDFLRSRYGFHADRASETLRPVMPRRAHAAEHFREHTVHAAGAVQLRGNCADRVHKIDCSGGQVHVSGGISESDEMKKMTLLT